MGDGSSSVSELVKIQINNALRGITEDHSANFVSIDSAVRLELKKQGYAPDSVARFGARILIKRNGNVAIDVTERVHSEVAEIAALAARIVGLDIAGIKLITRDISRPLTEQGGAIVEVNADPGLLMHLKPAEGEPRPVGSAIVDGLFPEGESGRIPVVGIAGTGDNSILARLVAWLLKRGGKNVGTACGTGFYLGDRQVERGDRANRSFAHKVLLNRTVEAAVFENGPHTILGDGLAYDRCLVGVVTGISHDARADEFDICSADQMADVLRTQVGLVLPGGAAVLNAGDERVSAMAKYCGGKVIYYSSRGIEPHIRSHLAQGKPVLFVRDGKIVVAETGGEFELIETASLAGGIDLEQALAGIGVAWALGLSHELICTGLASFSPEK